MAEGNHQDTIVAAAILSWCQTMELYAKRSGFISFSLIVVSLRLTEAERLWTRFMETSNGLRDPAIEIPAANPLIPRTEADFWAFSNGFPRPFCSDRRQIMQIRDIFSRYRYIDSHTSEKEDQFGRSIETFSKISLELRPPSERSRQLFEDYIMNYPHAVTDLQKIAFGLMWVSLFRTEPHRVTFKLVTTEAFSSAHGRTWHFMLALEYEGGGPSMSFCSGARHPGRLLGLGEDSTPTLKLLKMRLLDGIDDCDPEMSDLQFTTLLLLLFGKVGFLPDYLACIVGHFHAINNPS